MAAKFCGVEQNAVMEERGHNDIFEDVLVCC